MASCEVLLLLGIVCCLSYFVNVGGGHRKLSREEELDIEKQLEPLNKAALKTIKAQSGDIYDCIDFYKQPAFDHPLLKNHTFHFRMRPSSRPKKMKNKQQSSKVGQPLLKIGLQGEGCPIGTVPIRRSTKKDLIRAKLFTDTYASKFSSLDGSDSLHRAVVQTKPIPDKKYNGGGSTFSVYRPRVSTSQYSSAQMTIKNGLDSIQVGWTVNPNLYGDNNTRIFTFLKAGSSSCFNTQCPGFIIVDTEIPLDSIILPISPQNCSETSLSPPSAKEFQIRHLCKSGSLPDAFQVLNSIDSGEITTWPTNPCPRTSRLCLQPKNDRCNQNHNSHTRATSNLATQHSLRRNRRTAHQNQYQTSPHLLPPLAATPRNANNQHLHAPRRAPPSDQNRKKKPSAASARDHRKKTHLRFVLRRAATTISPSTSMPKPAELCAPGDHTPNCRCSSPRRRSAPKTTVPAATKAVTTPGFYT
ncbi:hypothetical protein TorRG33x02_030150 [Trema orientale]|uniref:Neprosin PEP catalytic domain-containing protein n=1 Tax=Trema orientale TaxID=63057 RepID=A0A2P5FU03_TREOI|nr:hypothetical protein TorRG33x02_030150 [Trema orientale]